ncbi:MAG: hypothetical protein K2Q32_04955, partial [Alphaproteobacteria bacterium]|nr:hypothetical protein [Alphaproteobacteria bacterium]
LPVERRFWVVFKRPAVCCNDNKFERAPADSDTFDKAIVELLSINLNTTPSYSHLCMDNPYEGMIPYAKRVPKFNKKMHFESIICKYGGMIYPGKNFLAGNFFPAINSIVIETKQNDF